MDSFWDNSNGSIADAASLANVPSTMPCCSLFLYNQSKRVRYPENINLPNVDAAQRSARRVADGFMKVVPYWIELTSNSGAAMWLKLWRRQLDFD